MAFSIPKPKHWRPCYQLWDSLIRLCSSSSSVSPSPESLEESMKTLVATKSYSQIPDLLQSNQHYSNSKTQNPFSFLSSFSPTHRTLVIDQMLQSFIPSKPYTRLKQTYNHLLTYTLQTPDPFPLALATLQRTLRSGLTPIPQIHLLLSSPWIDHRSIPRLVPNILSSMNSIRYPPDSGTCNYIITSLCAVNQLDEAVEVLRGMVKASCARDVESYGAVIAAFAGVRKTNMAVKLVKEMAGEKLNLSPMQGMLVKLAAALRANREIWRAADVVEWLEAMGVHVRFECYEVVVEGCLECRDFVLAGKMAMLMADKGYIPYIGVRKKVVEWLAVVGEWELACAVRHRFAQLKS